MPTSRKPITPQPTRWKPNPDPSSIVIPGLDTEASTVDQIEQIEQLITIKLQNIDENFSKIHNVLANKLLPAVKRYAVGTEPVREAAKACFPSVKFWTSFYEQAAQIRIPTFDDYSTVNEVPSEHEEIQEQADKNTEIENQTTRPAPEIYETSAVNSETSFMPGQGAFSSTPAIARQGATDHSYATQGSDPSWTPSMESPLVRLNREINNFVNESTEDSIITSSSSAAQFTPTPAPVETRQEYEPSNFTFQAPTPSEAPRSEKGKGKAPPQPLLKEVLRHTLFNANDSSSFTNNTIKTSPFKFRAKPKTPTIDKSLNPYLRSDDTTASTSNWSGVVDLRDPNVLTPKRGQSKKLASKNPTSAYDDDDDSFDGLPPGMSPPVLMSPARPPRSSAELGLLRLGQTPARDASMRIQHDLLRAEQMRSGGVSIGGRRLSTFPKPDESSMSSTAPTPPSLSRYSRRDDYSTSSSVTKDSSLESMIRHIRSGIAPNVGMTPGMGSTPGLRIRPRAQAQPQQQQRQAEEAPRAYEREYTPPRQYQEDQQRGYSYPSEPATPMYGQQQHLRDDDIDSDSDSLDEINNTGHPSAAFLMASQGIGGDYDDSDSFESNRSDDSLNDEAVAEGIVPVHPFAMTGGTIEDDGFDDDSFDDDDDMQRGRGGEDQYEEETVFGVHPAQRQQLHQARQSDGQNLRMMGDTLLQDTIGIGTQLAASGRVEESPTPASWAH
ncbi:DASH complex subunit ask1 [Psilocybe cubensis]|uniref:DASH complex subunit ASK1 n=2 Tax=Psilocybe cubensis TaxID=181762 RepID=A0A8H7Y703_PSICU|nr:DASH complex subunit ask1 [Psilocybe cubensis]KAH9486470.1 DASH complex subunit ask1 [Psilocybe cubensis]